MDKKLIRCVKCKARLYDLLEGGVVVRAVIKCPKCGHLNKYAEIKYNPDYETRATS